MTMSPPVAPPPWFENGDPVGRRVSYCIDGRFSGIDISRTVHTDGNEAVILKVWKAPKEQGVVTFVVLGAKRQH